MVRRRRMCLSALKDKGQGVSLKGLHAQLCARNGTRKITFTRALTTPKCSGADGSHREKCCEVQKHKFFHFSLHVIPAVLYCIVPLNPAEFWRSPLKCYFNFLIVSLDPYSKEAGVLRDFSLNGPVSNQLSEKERKKISKLFILRCCWLKQHELYIGMNLLILSHLRGGVYF